VLYVSYDNITIFLRWRGEIGEIVGKKGREKDKRDRDRDRD
jgi:hypothetical protein